MQDDLIKSSIVDAKKVASVLEDRAKNMFAKEFSPKIKNMLESVINEEVSSGNDQPGGYSPEEDKDAIQGGSNINKNAGDGPVVTYPAASDVKEGEDLPVDDEELAEEELPAEDDEEVVEADDLGLGDEEEVSEEEIPSLDDEEVAEVSAEDAVDDEDVLEVVADDEEGEKEEVPALEAIQKENKRLVRENRILRKAVGILKNKFEKVDLFNAKLAHAFDLMSQPGLSRKEKKQIAESFDQAKSVRETKLIYKTLKQSLSRRATTSPVKTNTNVKSVISEQTKSASVVNNRLTELAGL